MSSTNIPTRRSNRLQARTISPGPDSISRPRRRSSSSNGQPTGAQEISSIRQTARCPTQSGHDGVTSHSGRSYNLQYQQQVRVMTAEDDLVSSITRNVPTSPSRNVLNAEEPPTSNEDYY